MHIVTEDIRNGLRSFLTKDIMKDPSYPLQDDEALISSGLIDSFSLVDVALWVENTYGVKLQDNQLNASTFDSVAQLADLIQSQR
jgi:acyl carrier protein